MDRRAWSSASRTSWRRPARCGGLGGSRDVRFLDLAGYTRLTEEQGDAAAADLAETLADNWSTGPPASSGVPVKWLGDGVMVRYREAGRSGPVGATAGGPAPRGRPAAPAHVGIAARPVVVQGGDYFGRTVGLAARIAAHASAGQVVVSQSVAESVPPQGVRFAELETAAQGDGPSGSAARGQPDVTSDASAWPPAGPSPGTAEPEQARRPPHGRTDDPNHWPPAGRGCGQRIAESFDVQRVAPSPRPPGQVQCDVRLIRPVLRSGVWWNDQQNDRRSFTYSQHPTTGGTRRASHRHRRHVLSRP